VESRLSGDRVGYALPLQCPDSLRGRNRLLLDVPKARRSSAALISCPYHMYTDDVVPLPVVCAHADDKKWSPPRYVDVVVYVLMLAV
jgi:hypothetical protein